MEKRVSDAELGLMTERVGYAWKNFEDQQATIRAADLKAAWHGLDPLESPERNAGKPALLVNARWDTVIPRANARKLLEAFPAAHQVWVQGGHYTAIVHLLWLPRWISGVLPSTTE